MSAARSEGSPRAAPHRERALRHGFGLSEAAPLLYLITPPTALSAEEYRALLRAAAEGGVRVAQLRVKDARCRTELEIAAQSFVAAAREVGVIALINDDPVLARGAGAAGVHVGEDDTPIARCRELLGPRAIIGATVSGHERSIERARAAHRAGANYIGVGAIYDARATKANASAPQGPQLITTLRDDPALADACLIAIGGIDAANAKACVDAGADGVAVVRSVTGAADPRAAAAAIVDAMKRAAP